MTQSQAASFSGYPKPHYTQIPDEILDGLGSRPYTETLVLIYIARRTFGFRKDEDAISYKQFTDGIQTRDGRVLDSGCGIKSRKTLSATIKSLEEQGMIMVERSQKNGENQTTVYRLKLREEVVALGNYRSSPGELPVVARGNQQHNSEQETVLQQLPPTPQGATIIPFPTEDPAPPVEEKVALEEKTTLPPTPSPAARKRKPEVLDEMLDGIMGPDRMLDSRSRTRLRRAFESSGWWEYPDRMRRMRVKIKKIWSDRDPTSVDESQLDLLMENVSPDEADEFMKRSINYVELVKRENKYIFGLKRWLTEKWRDWKIVDVKPQAPRSMAEAMVLRSEQQRKEAL